MVCMSIDSGEAGGGISIGRRSTQGFPLLPQNGETATRKVCTSASIRSIEISSRDAHLPYSQIFTDVVTFVQK